MARLKFNSPRSLLIAGTMLLWILVRQAPSLAAVSVPPG